MVIAANLDDPARLADLAASNLDLKLEDAQRILESHRPDRAAAPRQREPRQGDHRPDDAAGDLDAGARRDGPVAARVLPAPAAARDPAGARRGRGDRPRSSTDYRKIIAEKKIPPEAATEIEKQIKRLERSHPDSAETAIIRTYLDWMTGLPWGSHLRGLRGHRAGAQDPRRGPLRHREGQGAHPRVPRGPRPEEDAEGADPLLRRAAGRRQDLARPLDRRARSAASSCGSRSAACATRPRSAATAAPTSARCPAASSRESTRPARRTRSSCSTRSTRSARTTAGDPSLGAPRGPRPGAELLLPRPLPRRALRPLAVLFIATANILDPIQPAFLDRMEVIRLSGYTLEEKKAIARRHLIPKQMEENGITEANVEFTDGGHREDHRGLHARGGPAQPRARDRRDLPQGRRLGRQGQDAPLPHHAAPSVEKMLGPVKHFCRRAPEEGPGRRRDRPRLDLGRAATSSSSRRSRCAARGACA